MNPCELISVVDNLRNFDAALQSAYQTAVKRHEQYLEILLHGLIEDTEKLSRRLGRIIDASIIQENAADESELSSEKGHP
jgi:hypothetical protein